MVYKRTFWGSLLVALLFVTTSVEAKTTQNTNLSISDIVELLISLDIIAEDKVELARELVKEKTISTETQVKIEKVDNPNKYTYNKCSYGQFKKALVVGDENDEVLQLQKFLASEKDVYPEAKVTGYYGPLTEKAVKKYQEKYGIEQAGVVGPKTRAMMNKHYNDCVIQKKNKEKVEEKKEEKDDDIEDKYEDSTLESIELSVIEEKEKIVWEVDGKSPKGYKIMWSLDEGPEYPTRDGDKYYHTPATGDGSRKLYAFDGSGTYYVRVCEYLRDGTCGIYSNEVSIALIDNEDEDTGETDEDVSEIELHADQDNEKVWWETEGTSEKGYKIVWSKESGPTYPSRSDYDDEYIYLSSPDADHTALSAFDGEGEYFVRVCEYLGGACGVYSNEVTIDL